MPGSSVNKIRDFIVSTLYKHGANDIISLDVRKKCEFTEYMIIASGTSSNHVRSLVDHIKRNKYGKTFVEGAQEGNWAIVSLRNIIVHIFRPDVREYYNLEELWKNGDASSISPAVSIQ